jgi:hypothetical protein
MPDEACLALLKLVFEDLFLVIGFHSFFAIIRFHQLLTE